MTNNNGISQPWVLRCRAGGAVRLRLSVDAANSGGYPIDRDYDLPKFCAKGRDLTDQQEMRQGLVKRTGEHLADLCLLYPEEVVIAYVGNGNLLANYGFVAWRTGELYHLADEPVFKRPYTCVVCRKDGQVVVRDSWFASENGRIIVLARIDRTVQDITTEIDLAASGQPLVRGGETVPLEQIAEQWYDVRHLVSPLRIAVNGTALFVPNWQLQQGLLRKALCQPIHVRLEAAVDEETRLPLTSPGWLRMAKDDPAALARAAVFLEQRGVLSDNEQIEKADTLLRVAETMEGLLEKALEDAGYGLVDESRPLGEGEARFLNGHLEIFLNKALYPHNIFVTWPDGAWGFVIFPGKSGREGTTLPGAQRLLTQELGVQDAILLDNGGDVRLWYRGRDLVPSSEGRDEMRSILALTTPKGEWPGDAIVVS